MDWIPLSVHSQYSILEALAPIADIALMAKKMGMTACALTDYGNLYGCIDFYKACLKQGIKPLIGTKLYVAFGSRHEKKKNPHFRPGYWLIVLAKNTVGYRNLCALSSLGFLEGFYYYPRVDKELLEKYREGLICISGSPFTLIGELISAGDVARGEEEVLWLKNLFLDDFYLELQRHNMSVEAIEQSGIRSESWLYQQYTDFVEKEAKINRCLVDLSSKHSIDLVATNSSHYIYSQDWEAHEALLNIQSGEPCELWEKDTYGNLRQKIRNPKRRTFSSHEFYFKSPEEMRDLFHDLPQAIYNTQKVADKCTLTIDLSTKHYPEFIPPALTGKSFGLEEKKKATEDYLWELCKSNLSLKYTPEALKKVAEKYPTQEPMEVVHNRLSLEMKIVASKELCDYLLIVHDFIRWAKEKNIPVGPGRGSGVGSVILYLIGVTDIEPLRFNLLFERFINPERVSYPDIDVDICMARRADVIEYALDKYGKENVAQIITFGTMKAKMTIRDVGRVLSVPLSKVNAIAKLVPEELNITLERALEVDPELKASYDQDEETRRIIDIGRRLEGAIRNTGIHAAGLIISAQPLVNFIPICSSKDSDMAVTQFSMKPVESVGMLKIDFLGLKTLTSIQKSLEMVYQNTGNKIELGDISLEDEKTFSLLNQGKTLGVFQLESGGMRELAKQLHLDRFEEIFAMVALYRPGPMDMIPSFINRKHGKESIEYDHPWMEEILAETYGIMVYQEQVMQIASKLAHFSLGEGDVLRHAMGKKDTREMIKQRSKFVQGAMKNGISEALSTSIFDKMEKFAQYGFNKSHAAAYAYISYVTAYIKANYPYEWMAALMTCDRDDVSKVSKFIRECKALEIPILPPDVNEAGDEFTPTSKGIRFAISAIKGMGSAVVETIVEERQKNGPFLNLYDFCHRCDPKRVTKKTVELLIDAGCFDFTEWSRDALKLHLDQIYEIAIKEQKEKMQGVLSLFQREGPSQAFCKAPEVLESSTLEAILLKEKELLGFFLTGHPLDAYQSLKNQLGCTYLSELSHLEHGQVARVIFVIDGLQTKISIRTQKKFAILSISDQLDSLELPIWTDVYEQKASLFFENALMYAIIQVDKKEEGFRLTARWLSSLTSLSQEEIAQADKAHDMAKMMGGRSKKNGVKMKTKSLDSQTPGSIAGKLELLLDINQITLSHIMELKKLFQQYSGNTVVCLYFLDQKEEVGQLNIDATFGVTLQPEFLEILRQFSFLQIQQSA